MIPAQKLFTVGWMVVEFSADIYDSEFIGMFKMWCKDKAVKILAALLGINAISLIMMLIKLNTRVKCYNYPYPYNYSDSEYLRVLDDNNLLYIYNGKVSFYLPWQI